MDVDPTERPEQQGIIKKKLTLAFEDYKRITKMLVVYIRSEEEKRMAGMHFILDFKCSKECIEFFYHTKSTITPSNCSDLYTHTQLLVILVNRMEL